MFNFRKAVRPLALAGTAVVVALVVMGAGRGKTLPAYRTGYVLPASMIISYDDTVGLLDTATGAVYMFSGDLRNASVRNTWELRVPGVKEETSGMLEIQRATFNNPEATFLVDVVTGRTWILRRRGNHNGTWDPVEIFR